MSTVAEPHFHSSVLLVSRQTIPNINLGADHAPDGDAGEAALKAQDYDVVAVDLTFAKLQSFQLALAELRKRNPSTQTIIIAGNNEKIADWLPSLNGMRISNLALGFDSQHLEEQISRCLERAQQEQQNEQLEDLIKEQTAQLKSLYQELDERVQKRQKFLEESRAKTMVANIRWQALREAMIAVHQSLSVSDMEQGLASALSNPLEITLVRILFKPQDSSFAIQNKSYKSFSAYQAPIFRDQQNLGSIFFLRDPKKPFNKDENEFLSRVSEAVSLALDRLGHLEQSETLREQWQATFNAISDPVVLINSSYEVLQSNISAEKRSQQNTFVQPKCYQMLFQRDSACPNCHLGKAFRIEGRSEILDVSSQKIDGLYFNIYHDLSSKLRMERKILETVRMAELGTIGSSIAHELNNPLGGILSFVQLIKMDLPSASPYYSDIEEMESGVKRCRDIIQNLLGFTRNPDVDEVSILDLKEVIARAIKIVELQTRSQNIEIKSLLPSGAAPFKGHFNMLSQAIKNILQLAIDALVDKNRLGRGSSSIIEISLESSQNQWIIKILDNGPGAGRRNSLQFSISTQIIHEHEGLVDISTQPRQMTMAKISLPQQGF